MSPIDQIKKFEDELPKMAIKRIGTPVEYKHRCPTCGGDMTGFNAESVYEAALRLWAVSAKGKPPEVADGGDYLAATIELLTTLRDHA